MVGPRHAGEFLFLRSARAQDPAPYPPDRPCLVRPRLGLDIAFAGPDFSVLLLENQSMYNRYFQEVRSALRSTATSGEGEWRDSKPSMFDQSGP